MGLEEGKAVIVKVAVAHVAEDLPAVPTADGALRVTLHAETRVVLLGHVARLDLDTNPGTHVAICLGGGGGMRENGVRGEG